MSASVVKINRKGKTQHRWIMITGQSVAQLVGVSVGPLSVGWCVSRSIVCWSVGQSVSQIERQSVSQSDRETIGESDRQSDRQSMRSIFSGVLKPHTCISQLCIHIHTHTHTP